MASTPGAGRGVVAAGHPETAAAAVDVLRQGGNAYDAAVAAGFAAALAEPSLTSLGGGGFMLARTAGGQETVFDFFVDTPGRGRAAAELAPEFLPVTLRFGGAEQVFNVGAGSIAAPGCLPGYLHIHRRLGRLGLAEVLAPARRLAEEGVALGAAQADIVRLLEPIYTLSDEGRRRYTRGDRVVGAAEPVRNPPLAAFLAEVAAGRADGFAAVAHAVEAQMDAGAGLLTAADLTGYQVVERPPLVYTFRGARIAANPSFGGQIVRLALAALEQDGAPEPFGSPERLRLLAHALEQAGSERARAGFVASRGTTHVSVCDAEGNLAAMTTSNGSCSGVFLADTGIMANNMMGEADLHPGGFHAEPPGRRVGSMMVPTLVADGRRGTVALGSGGSERIRSALTQVIANLVDHGMSLPEAVEAPRIHFDGRLVQMEPGFAPTSARALAEVRPVNQWTVSDLYFGGAHAVSTRGERAGDPRRGGVAVAV